MDQVKLIRAWPGHTDEAHPEIFNTVPPQQTHFKPGQLSAGQLKQFFEEGYLLIDSFFTHDELDPGKVAIDLMVNDLANKLFKAGKTKSSYSEYGVFERLTMVEKDFPGANVILHKTGAMPQALRDLWANERALNLAEQILGTADIAGHPNWNLRCKTPNNEASTVPWHQDVAYLDNKSYETFQLTAWIPFLDTDAKNGCMQLIRRGHKTGRVADHQCCTGNTWYVMLVEEEIGKKLECDVNEDIVTCPVAYGSILIFNNLIPHRSLNNTSDKIRWSIDVRWQRADADVCMYGLKESIRMRSSTDPDYQIDWEQFNSVNRFQKAFEALGQEETEFDTTIPGLWMRKWEIVHTNVHTEALEAEEKNNWQNVTVVG